jgi:hypothetical protein
MQERKIVSQLEDAKKRLETTDCTVITTRNQPFNAFSLREISLTEAVELAVELAVETVYILEAWDELETLQAAGIYFEYNGRIHSVVHSADSVSEQATDQQQSGLSSPYRDETEDEKQKRADLIDEILSEYSEYLSDDEVFELENRPERMRVQRLMRMRDRLEEEARTDPEEEKRLARIVYETDQFGRQFNQTDTEMLLDQLDVEYDPDLIRIDEVHKRAKSLLKVNR